MIKNTNMAEDKRRRALNFSKGEESLLLELVHKYRHTVQCKKTDALTNKQKEVAWEKLTNDFNVKSGMVPRTPDNLKSKFDNIKREAKKNLTAERKVYTGTGGGRPTPPSFDTKSLIFDIMGYGLTGLHTPYDSNRRTTTAPGTETTTDPSTEDAGDVDFDSVDTGDEVELTLPVFDDDFEAGHYLRQRYGDVPNTTEEDEDADDPKIGCQQQTGRVKPEVCYDWSASTPDMLRQPISRELGGKKEGSAKRVLKPLPKNVASAKIGKLADLKSAHVSMKTKLMIKESRVRRRQEKVIHNIQCKLLTVQFRIKQMQLRKLKNRRKKKPQTFEVIHESAEAQAQQKAVSVDPPIAVATRPYVKNTDKN